MLPMTAVGLTGGNTMAPGTGVEQGPGIIQWLALHFSPGSWTYIITYGVLVAFFCFFYTSIMFNPQETADNLRKYGGFVPGIRPGKATADYLDFVLNRIFGVASSMDAFKGRADTEEEAPDANSGRR